MAKYRVQRDGDIKTFDEKKLRKKLRSNDLTGLELVRRQDDEDWTPLCETALFRDEVPFRGQPLDAARRREVQGFGGHLTGWLITAGVMAALGDWFPVWLLIWGVFLLMHAAKVAPSALRLWLAGDLLSAPTQTSLAAATPQSQAIEAPQSHAPLAGEIGEIRALLNKRGDAQAARLTQEVEQLASTMHQIGRRRADLEAQLSPNEMRELETARDETNLRLQNATTEQDRDLLQQELEAIDQRQQAVEQAQRTLTRLQSQERKAQHQLKQLRLDLSQAEARSVDVPNLADRVEALRLDAAAVEEVEEVLAASRRAAQNRLSEG